MPRELTHAPDVAELLATSDVWDMTLPWVPIYWDMETLAAYRDAGYTFASASITDWPPTWEGTLDAFDRFKRIVDETEWLHFGGSLADIDRGRAEGKLVLGLNTQETNIVELDLSRLEVLHGLGVRHMLLAYNVRNLVADGCAEVADAGLSNYGRRFVREMNRVGIVVDVTHTGRRSSLEAIEISEAPVIFSHSNPSSLCTHIRNIDDDQIRACAETGGVVGIVGIGSFLGDADASTETMFRHVDYVASLVGPQHVGIGTDYVKQYPITDFAEWWGAVDAASWPHVEDAWPDPSGTQIPNGEGRCFAPDQLPGLVDVMLDHGYPKETIVGILGANFRRVYEAVGA